MASVLTGEQMISCRARLDRELPSLGFKEFQPTKSAFEQQYIEHALEERKVLLSEDRIEKCGNLSAADWKPELMRAQVTKKVGKHWEVFGHNKDNCEWLFPEEALFMLETNTLELSYDGVPVSVQKAYTILINNSKTDCTLSEYRVYSHLSRQGYRVVRHLPDLTVTSYEKQINLDQYILDQKRSYDVERKQTFISMSERTVSFSESENKEDISNISEDIVSRIMESNFEMLVPDRSKPTDTAGEPSNMPSTSGIVSHDVVVLDESTVESEVIEESSNRTTQLEEEDDDLDVIEVPQEPKEIIIETIDSDTTSEDSNDEDNDDANEDSSSDSDSDIHWKRRSVQPRSRPVEEVGEKCAIRSNYATIQEFLFDRESAKKTKPVVVIDLVDEGNNTIDNELKRFYNEIELIDLASDTENETSYIEEYVRKDRREILDCMPVMHNINGFVSVTCPDLRLIPENARPIKHEYKLPISRIREGQRQVTNYRNYRNHNQQRNYHGRGYQNMNSLFNRMRTNPWTRQNNMNPVLLQQATQIQTLAQGMMRFASTLMNQMCQPQVQNTNNSWNMNMPRFNNPAWQDAEMFTQNALMQRNFYSEQRNNENPNYSVPQFGQNSNPYQQHQSPVQSCNNYRGQYGHTPVNNYTSSVSNESSPVYHISVNNFSPSVNSYSQNSNSSVENIYEGNKREYSPSSARRGYNSPNKRFHRWGGGLQRGGRRPRQSLQSRHAAYQVNSMTVEEHRRGEDPAYSREDVPLRGDGFIPLTSNNTPATTTNNNTPRSNFQNNRRRRNREIVSVEDDDVTVVQTPRKRVKRENNQAKKKQGRKRYFSVSPENRKIRKQEGVDNEDGAEIIDIDVISEDLDVKQVTAQEKNSVLSDKAIPHTADVVTDVKPSVSEAVNESVHHTPNVKFENTDVKTEKSADSNFSSDIPSVPVKTETIQEQQQEGQQQSSSTTDRKLVKDVKQELPQQLDTKSTLSLTQNAVEAKISERLEVKTESCSENQNSSNNNIKTEKEISCSDENRIENNSRTTNEIKQEPLNGETPMETENSSGVINDSIQVEDNAIKQTSTEESVSVTDNCEKNCETVDESNRAATSWAELKNRPISVAEYNSYEESDGMEDTVEDETEDNDVQPIVKPEDCKNIASILSALQIFKKGEAPHYEVCRLKISFDMYLPSSTFKKVQRTLPNYRIVIVESLDPLPSPSEMAELRLRFQDSVQILLAVVMPDSIAFYTFGSVYLPVDDTSYKI